MKRERQQGGDIISVERHNRDFVMIDNSAVQDPNLGLKATGLLSLLISYPSNWKISLSHLCSVKPDGRDSILSGLTELSEAGYLLYLRWRDAGGLWTSRYIVFETPQLKEKYLEQMSKEDTEKITTPFSPSKAKAKKQNPSQETTTENPQWNENGKTVTEKPQWKNRSGESDPDKYIDTNTDQKNELEKKELEKKDPLTPQGGTGLLSEGGGKIEKPKPEGLGNQECSPKPPVATTIPETIPSDKPNISGEDQNSPAPTPKFSVHNAEHLEAIKRIYNSGKPKLWQPINNFYQHIKLDLESVISSDDFKGDLGAFLTRLENALSELSNPSTQYSWFAHQGNLGLKTLLNGYGKHLKEISDAWTLRQNPQTQANEALPDWLVEAYAEMEQEKLKKAG